MTEIDLPLNQSFISLSQGLALHPRGLTGRVSVSPATEAGARAFTDATLLPRLASEGLRPGPIVSLPAPAASVAARALATMAEVAEPQPILEVEVEPGQSCVLLVEDANGALSWLLPDEAPRSIDVPGARALTTSLRFTLPPVPASIPSPGSRDLLGDIGSKVQTFFFDATDALLGPVIHGFARKWEAKHRPSFVRRFGPDDYQVDDPAFERLTEDDWKRLAQGPALLFVHGTFSTSAAFRALEPGVVRALSRQYGDRAFAYNHPSLTADPRENALAFLASIPQGVSLEIDIVCHSRGGLVARQIEALGRKAGSVRVRRIVFVAATNAGTALADDDHIVDLVNRYTTIARFIPAGTAATVVDALVLAVKVLAHGLLHDLEGLAAMNPHGAFLATMNVPGELSAELYAIASDFEPKPGTPFLSLRRAEDIAADGVFGTEANDLVVPRDGVFAQNGATGFPIGTVRCLQYAPVDGVIHTEFFAEPRTGAKLLEWLAPAEAAAGRGVLTAALSPGDVAHLMDAARDRVLLQLASGSRGLGSKPPPFSPAELDQLRPHVVNLSEGTFRSSGIYSTTKEDVDAIVHEHIPKWAGTLPAGEPLRVAIWAHGGLVGEEAGLRIAQKHVEWWKQNGVYPIYFVWETGLFDALRAILEQVRGKIPGFGARDLFDVTSDLLIEMGARALGGGKIWRAMKRNAELASGADGGARYVGQQLAVLAGKPDLLKGHALELHAVGHSAGSIFHSWFLPVARSQGVPAFKTLQLLAPAITVADFDQRLLPEIGGGAAKAAVLFTMKRHYEEADNCAGVYRKSLLYLIHHALEPEKRTPVLGLEISLRADDMAARLFGLRSATGASGRAVWSVTDESTGASASTAVHHGDFDDDSPTMSAVAANVLGAQEARVRYPGSPRDARDVGEQWPVSNEWLSGVDLSLGSGALAAVLPVNATSPAPPSSPIRPASVVPTVPVPIQPAGGPSSGSAAGTRRALCVGIDAYKPPNTLQGCVNDTASWGRVLGALGFKVDKLLDEHATRQAMLDALTAMVRSAQPGDVLVFQYSGHGTQVPDEDGDEGGQPDEAMVPYDFEDGAFLIDDDLRGVFMQLPAGVNLTCFVDCCHSGTITRMLGRNVDESASDGASLSRYLKVTEEWPDWMRAHHRFRQRERAIRDMGMGRSLKVDANIMRWVDFSACDATEVAYETQGSGDFTRLATALLSQAGGQRTHREFQDAIVKAFGERRRQTPQLDCADSATALGLLQPLG
jgi:hypothetical protein